MADIVMTVLVRVDPLLPIDFSFEDPEAIGSSGASSKCIDGTTATGSDSFSESYSLSSIAKGESDS